MFVYKYTHIFYMYINIYMYINTYKYVYKYVYIIYIICVYVFSKDFQKHNSPKVNLPNGQCAKFNELFGKWIQYIGIYPNLLPLCSAKIVIFALMSLSTEPLWSLPQREVFSLTSELPQWLCYLSPSDTNQCSPWNAEWHTFGQHRHRYWRLFTRLLQRHLLLNPGLVVSSLQWPHAKIHQTIQNVLLHFIASELWDTRVESQVWNRLLIFSFSSEECNVK